ncbi:hypothetical protein M422DRAFT_234970 [Sphaerobolus stellatus SS14]|uniref:Unplaced genomic scaffold SPHSTscaffold_192, whole genome shotgun sequence n=1 Tax=Sphaerobolus stellatus (strain SS14) TaxID=990650 RepID=A0A0C9U768_SPHS4|nr:hypothetical protein M422DRAFT_234970 [Sphaerobolus stellatus SS14]
MPALASVEVGEAKPGESRVRRSPLHPEYLTERPMEGVDTAHDVLLYNARVHGTKQAFGWRDIVDIHEEVKDVKKMVGGKEVIEKKTWSYWQLSDYKYVSFIEFRDTVSEVAKGLVELGLQKEDVFNIYSATCLNWQIMSHACFQISATIATAYESLGEAGLLHALNEPDCKGIFTNAELIPVLLKVIADAKTVKIIVFDGKPSEDHLAKIREIRPDLSLIHIDDLRKTGQGKPEPDRAPTKETIACIMYTSGTTGPPKGVVLSHANLVAGVGGIKDLFGDDLRAEDTYLAFLPLAHILEMIVELSLSFYGMTIGYARIKTLTDASVRNCLGDLRAFRPTILVGVPAVFENIRKGIVGKVNQSGILKKTVFGGALSIKRAGVPGLKTIVDSAVFNQVRQQTGGRLRLALSGGAALSRETQEFLTLALVTVLQGYGATECVAMCAILMPAFFSYGPVGGPVPAVELKLLDHAEAGYLTSGNPPRGEVLVRGASITKGYFKRDDLNNDRTIFTEDGWFRTGDVGQWNPDGTLSVIDRIKNLVKLQGGEYVALERLECVYKSCNLVANICVHAHSDARQPIAIIHPHESNLRHALAGESRYESMDLEHMCHDPKVIDLVLKECNAAGKKGGFKGIEVLQAVVLTHEEWTPESGLVTAAQKLQRRKIDERYQKDIKAAYKNAQG